MHSVVANSPFQNMLIYSELTVSSISSIDSLGQGQICMLFIYLFILFTDTQINTRQSSPHAYIIYLALPQGISIADVSAILPRLPEPPSGNLRWGCSIAPRPAEADHMCMSGAEWLRVGSILCGDIRPLRPAGDEATASAGS
jgi:hypothetical protein